MKKEDISNILIHLWNCVDQADYSDDVEKAFENCPVKIQKELIETLLGGKMSGWEDEPDEDILLKAMKLVGIEDDEIRL